jgi:large conductance mechanosensitive channel
MVIKEFREFIMRGNVIDMAVGIIIGAAFGRIIDSLVKDIIMPPVGLLLGNVDFANMFVVLKQGASAGPYINLEAAQKAAAVTLNYGIFINQLVSFAIIAFAVFLLIRYINRMRRKQAQSPTDAPAPPEDTLLLREIRDALTTGR